ncbi:MAG TPA: hypothetical protein VFK14_12680 [Solirubrobacterales bacterium]|nr:hypothetical protein [Solirubrobacterales bacterium]
MKGGLACACALAALAAALLPTAADATLVIPAESLSLTTYGAGGQPESRAGAHPDRLVQGFEIEQAPGPEEDLKSVVVELPPGLSGDPSAVPFCPRPDLEPLLESACPADSQVGVFFAAGEPNGIYNLAPGPGEAAAFGVAALQPIILSGKLRPADGGLSLAIPRIDPFKGLGEGSGFQGATMELWGIPADHQQGGETAARRALLTTPTRCGTALGSTVVLRTWQNPETPIVASVDTGMPLSGCDQLPFDPSLSLQLDQATADTPTGARVGIAMPPEPSDPEARAQSQIEDLKLEFPPGMTISLGAAAGLAACTDAQLGRGTEAEPQCPAASKVGSIELRIASQEKPLEGSIYLGQEAPGERFRLFIAASGAGTTVKLTAALEVDPASGQISADLPNLPQAPFREITLHLDGGTGALLATPLGCGPATATATLTPYSGGAVARREANLDFAPASGGSCGAGLPFSPSLEGGSTSDRAGLPTGFTTTVRRKDGEALPSRVEVPLPEGMSAALGTVPLCDGAAAGAGDCPAASRIGSAVAELGPGPSPAAIGGGIYLTGSYRNAPYGLSIALRGEIGPFDLGRIAVRAALRIDPLSGRVEVLTDPLPTAVEGIPVRFREIGLDLDRPGFLRNPTGCRPQQLAASFRSQEGASASASVPYDIEGCIDLPFHPRFSLALQGRSQLRRGGRPGLLIGARLPAGEASLLSSKIVLPRLLRFTGKGALELCSRGAAAEERCGRKSRIGTAVARTPLLKGPMKGYVYSVQPEGTGLPGIWVDLRGSGVRVELQGKTQVKHHHPVTALTGIPDFPLSSFRLRLRGGKHGPLTLAAAPCGRRLRAALRLIGHNAAETRPHARIAVPCHRHG